jgi:hypothetical protein
VLFAEMTRHRKPLITLQSARTALKCIGQRKQVAVTDRSTELKPCPWKVYVGKLRPQFPTPIVEIYDANDDVVLPWGAFDLTGLSGAKQKALAKRIEHR